MKNRKYFIISGVIAFLGISFLIISPFLNKSSDDKNDNNQNLNNNDSPSSKVECEKSIESTDIRDITYLYILNFDSSDNIVNYTFKNTIDYKVKAEYDKMKNVDFPDMEVSYDDNELIIFKSLFSNKILDDKGVETKVSYKDYISSLEKDGYTCKEE